MEQAKTVLQFMARVQLQGSEVPAFNQSITWLQEQAQPREETESD